MKIAFDISPLKKEHKNRGIGTYTESLLTELQKSNQEIIVTPFEKITQIPKVDIIHHPYFDFYRSSLPLHKKYPTVVTIHDAVPLVFKEQFKSGIKGKIILNKQKIALRSAKAVVTDSNTSKKDIIKYLSYPDAKIFPIYLAPRGVFRVIKSKNELQTTSAKYNLPKEFLLYVGDINWNKNILNLLNAVKISKKKIVLVGSAFKSGSSTERKQILETIKNLALTSQVIILGFVPEEDLVKIYNLAKVTLLPSFYEGFGLPVLESLACGTQVICSNNSSLKEISGNLAVYCDPYNPSDIAEKILNIEKYKQDPAKLLKHVHKYTWSKTAEKTIEVYRQIFDPPSQDW